MARDGKPMRIGRSPDFRHKEPYRYKCAACGLVTALTAEDFARIPEATLAQLREVGLGWMVENDLRGQGAEDHEIEALTKEKSLESGVRRLAATCRRRAARAS